MGQNELLLNLDLSTGTLAGSNEIVESRSEAGGAVLPA
jgi:hypothetical protein